jgi:hypothetical protein
VALKIDLTTGAPPLFAQRAAALLTISSELELGATRAYTNKEDFDTYREAVGAMLHVTRDVNTATRMCQANALHTGLSLEDTDQLLSFLWAFSEGRHPFRDLVAFENRNLLLESRAPPTPFSPARVNPKVAKLSTGPTTTMDAGPDSTTYTGHCHQPVTAPAKTSKQMQQAPTQVVCSEQESLFKRKKKQGMGEVIFRSAVGLLL